MFSFAPLSPAPLLLALALSAQGPLDVELLRPSDGPLLLVHDQPGPLVALRLSAPVDPTLPEGTVELLQELARPRAQSAADRFGARLWFRNEGGAAVIAVTGPLAAFDALAALLRASVSELDLSVAALQTARARAESRVLARLERPEPRVRRLLRHQLFGGPAPVGPSGTRLQPEDIRRARGQLYRTTALRVTVVGRVPPPVLRSAFTGWPASTGARHAETVAPDGPGEPARPQAHREWAGLGYDVAASPAVVAVAAALIQDRIDRSPLRQGSAHAWAGPDGWALAVLGATEPGDSVVRATAGIGALPVRGEGPGEAATGVGRYLRRTIAEAAALTGSDAVASARSRLRWQLLLEARTPTGRAEGIGRLADALGPEAAPAFIGDLEAVDLEQVRALLRAVLEAPAHYVEAR